MGIKYHRLPIVDDRTMHSVLRLIGRAYLPISHVDIYVVMDTALVDATPQSLPQPGSFTWLLTQENHTPSFQPTMLVPPPFASNVPHYGYDIYRNPIHMTGNDGADPSTIDVSTPSHTSIPIYHNPIPMTGNDGAGPSTHPGLRSNPIHTSIQMSDPCIPNYTETRYQPDYHDWGDAQHVMYENMDEAYDDTLYGRPSPTGEIRSPYDEDDDDDVRPCGSPYEDGISSNDSYDEDWDLNCESPGGEIPLPDSSQLINAPIPYFMDIGSSEDNSIMKADIIPRGDVWTPETNEFTVGMLFRDKETLIYAVKLYHTNKLRHYRVIESNPTIWVCKCVSDCRWRLRASTKKNGYFVIKKYDGPHNCLLTVTGTGHKNLDSTLIAKHIMSTVREHPDIKIMAIVDLVKKEFNYTINYKKAWAARTKAIRMLFGDWDESYRQLPKFMFALKDSNPGTIVVWNRIRAENPDEEYMESVFWAFEPAINGFRHCRPVICIDGTHLYGKYTGKILIATGTTANNKVFPLAFAIVGEETSIAWKWFLKNLRRHIVPGREDVTLISDRAPGILHAVKRVWIEPREGIRGHHRYCIRHFCANYYKATNNQLLKDFIWHASTKCHQRRKLNADLQKIRDLDDKAFTNLMKEDITKWTIAHDGGKRWGIMTTNDVESFNGLMKGARSVPISACVQLTFYRLVKFFADQAAEAQQMQTEGLHFPRDVQEKLDLYQSRGMTHQVIPYDWDNLVFEVTTKFYNNAGTNRQTVKLNIPTCTCGKLEIFKIPCSHIFAAAAHVEITWLPFVTSEYKMEVYMRVWDTKFEPIKHPDYWPEYKGRTLLPLSTRLRPPKRGRPESTRIRNEMDVSRQRATKHCTNCKQPGHDRRTCPQRARIFQD
ncbi:hypothetical protein L1049_019961 [Liquidambar formosana]|uniref:SWIM-type domain-containing protein n=1 Tax=Liquidambar formosana TaxID=63359 RepID=A0AAP0S6G6_LIQFO